MTVVGPTTGAPATVALEMVATVEMPALATAVLVTPAAMMVPAATAGMTVAGTTVVPAGTMAAAGTTVVVMMVLIRTTLPILGRMTRMARIPTMVVLVGTMAAAGTTVVPAGTMAAAGTTVVVMMVLIRTTLPILGRMTRMARIPMTVVPGIPIPRIPSRSRSFHSGLYASVSGRSTSSAWPHAAGRLPACGVSPVCGSGWAAVRRRSFSRCLGRLPPVVFRILWSVLDGHWSGDELRSLAADAR